MSDEHCSHCSAYCIAHTVRLAYSKKLLNNNRSLRNRKKLLCAYALLQQIAVITGGIYVSASSNLKQKQYEFAHLLSLEFDSTLHERPFKVFVLLLLKLCDEFDVN